jgi:SanA protein
MISPRRKWFKRAAIVLVVGGILMLITALVCNSWIIRSTRDQIYSDVAKIPECKTGLLLGASKNTSSGTANLFYTYRIHAAAELFKAGKIRHIIVSGDNSRSDYDEASDMKNSLIELGVPDSCITQDYAGFRTFDSMVRCLKVFGQKEVTVISQEFHNQRAVFIGNYLDMKTVAFNAQDVPSAYSYKTTMREYLAKTKAVLDLYVLGTEPKFLGEPVVIK